MYVYHLIIGCISCPKLVTNEFLTSRFALINLLTKLGYVCLAIDSRGSARRGMQFEAHIKNRMVGYPHLAVSYACKLGVCLGYRGNQWPSWGLAVCCKQVWLHGFVTSWSVRVVIRYHFRGSMYMQVDIVPMSFWQVAIWHWLDWLSIQMSFVLLLLEHLSRIGKRMTLVILSGIWAHRSRIQRYLTIPYIPAWQTRPTCIQGWDVEYTETSLHNETVYLCRI